MKIAISQPEHFPYMGYFQKMSQADAFVILDDVQFSGPRSYQNRNKFINAAGEEEWFTVPVEKNSFYKLIKDVNTAPDFGWRKKLLKKIDYHFSMDLQDVFIPEKLVDINMNSINICKKAFGIHTPLFFSSEIPTTGNKNELLISICKYFQADTYVSGEGAKNYLDVNEFNKEGIDVIFLKPMLSNYDSSIIHLSEGRNEAGREELNQYMLYVSE
ncbi:WbqC family protein [Mesobacillus zeae]|uniref:WbqC family protein n=1 Tax=Mesobacillus zeae TaxID=1917180 RepID=A0A398BIC1_9BACI|nr:WbqC family protein [Mesobacillus zeae]RID88791.1 hypothetical protein D1970_00660 [Mesobacillus zeae]